MDSLDFLLEDMDSLKDLYLWIMADAIGRVDNHSNTKSEKPQKVKPESKPLSVNGKEVPIRNIYINRKKNTYTVVWKDGTHTVIKLQGNDVWDEEKALALCFVKRYYGNNGNYNEIFKKYCHFDNNNEDSEN